MGVNIQFFLSLCWSIYIGGRWGQLSEQQKLLWWKGVTGTDRGNSLVGSRPGNGEPSSALPQSIAVAGTRDGVRILDAQSGGDSRMKVRAAQLLEARQLWREIGPILAELARYQM